jgi:phosphoglucosamine mutase
MKKLFGTDGIRGKANVYPITPDLALKVGKALALFFRNGCSDKKLKVVIAHDTRVSAVMLQNAIVSGLLSLGADVYIVGIMPTPELAFFTKNTDTDFGIMITASHNPPCDNGIKIFNSEGFKLSDEQEEIIENYIFENNFESAMVAGDKVGVVLQNNFYIDRYNKFASQTIKNYTLAGKKIVIDCANGAASIIAPELFKKLGAELITTATEVDGYNINVNCGATYPENISNIVIENKADLGIAFDGDADRVIFCDSNGKIINGDRIIAICALDYKKRNILKGDAVVVTAMSNLGFHKAMNNAGIDVIVADIGDRYVIEEMVKNNCVIGGEQSGHIVFLDHGTTGDGIITALHILAVMQIEGKTLAELSNCMEEFPQELCNFTVKEKIPLEQCHKINEQIKKCESALGQNGRIMVRYSGTEPKIRVLIEAQLQSDVDYWMREMSNSINEELV